MKVVLCTRGGVIEPGTAEALSFARRLAAQNAVPLHWVIAGHVPPGGDACAAAHGVAGLDVFGELADAGPDALVEALAGYCREERPAIVLFNQDAAARLIAPRLAARLDVPVVMNVIDAAHAGGALEVTTTAFGGDIHAVYGIAAPACVLSLVTTAMRDEPAAEPVTPVRRDLAVGAAAPAERLRVCSTPRGEGPRLEDAERIVAGGRGLGKSENVALIRELADLVGGMWAGSRAIVDEGWIDSSRQVGLTGKITRPSLYVAAGISGASQHMAGCSAAGTLVAINKDRDAAIFRYARYGIVGDCIEVLPALTAAVRALGEQR